MLAYNGDLGWWALGILKASKLNRLEIEWCHLDVGGNTCIRCSETGQALNGVVGQLADECRSCGWEIVFKETKLNEKDIASSNVILFNSIPIEDILPEGKASESHGNSCCELTGDEQICCRTLEYGGKIFESIPASLIREAVCKVVGCC